MGQNSQSFLIILNGCIDLIARAFNGKEYFARFEHCLLVEDPEWKTGKWHVMLVVICRSVLDLHQS